MGREVREAYVVPRPWAGWTQSGPLQLALVLPLVTWGLSFLIFQVVVWNTDLCLFHLHLPPPPHALHSLP